MFFAYICHVVINSISILENILNTVVMISPSRTMTQPARPEIKGKEQSLKDSELSNWGGLVGRVARGVWQTEDVSTVSWELRSPHGVVMVWRERVTHEQNQLPLSLRLSNLSPIISPPAHLHWHHLPPQFTATYITLTNQRLWGFFFCLAFTTDIYFSPSAVPASEVICLAEKKITAVIHYIHPSSLCHLLFIYMLFCVNRESTSFLCHCTSALLYLLYHHPL